MYRYLMVLTISSTIGLQAWRTLFDNFAVRVVGLNGDHVGIIQSVREIPGFLALLAVFVILFIKEHRLSALSVLILGIGVAATGLFPSFGGLLVTTLIMSFGFHYFETTNQSHRRRGPSCCRGNAVGHRLPYSIYLRRIFKHDFPDVGTTN